MKYNNFGNTGDKISLLGFGAMRLPQKELNGSWYIDEEKSTPLIKKAVELGINYFDTAPYYCNSQSEAAVGQGLKGIRDKVKIATKSPLIKLNSVKEFRERFEKSLKELQTDYIDYYQFWSIDKELCDFGYRSGIFDEAVKLKEEGLIRHIGFSFHGDFRDLDYIVENCDIMEMALVNYNIYDKSRENAVSNAYKRGLGLVNMGALSTPGLTEDPTFRKEATEEGYNPYEIALKFVMQNKSFNSILSSINSVERLIKTVDFIDKDITLSDEEWDIINSTPEHITK